LCHVIGDRNLDGQFDRFGAGTHGDKIVLQRQSVKWLVISQ
jgi:hypothetical protein